MLRCDEHQAHPSRRDALQSGWARARTHICVDHRMTPALAAVVPSATQLRQLRLLSESADPVDVAELVCRVLMCLSHCLFEA